jgi:hypothetical protein
MVGMQDDGMLGVQGRTAASSLAKPLRLLNINTLQPTRTHTHTEPYTRSFSNMLLIVLFTFIASTTSAYYPSCARRGMFDIQNTAATTAFLYSPMQISSEACASICRQSLECGGYASTAKNKPTDLCFTFQRDV